MAFDAPAPGCRARLRRRRAEDRKEIPLRVAHQWTSARRLRRGRALRGFERAEHRLEIHDLRRRHVAALAETRLQQLVRELPLRLRHVFDRQSIARKRFGRDEVPVQTLLAVERERRLLPLAGRQALDESRRRGRHRRRRSIGRDRRAGDHSGEDPNGQPESFHRPTSRRF